MEPKYSTPVGSVAEQFGEIEKWLRGNLATVSISGATSGQIEEAAAATGRAWPAELVELYTRINGFPVDQWVQLLPGNELFDLDRVLREWQLELDIWGPMAEEMGFEVDPDAQAGDPAGTYLPEFIPFAGADGYLLFVDTRPGELHGCVTTFDKCAADDAGPSWVSISAMLTDLATSLRTGSEFDGYSAPTVVDGQLDWR
ncbi:SMI1/KNR4 family protein [Nocardia sp. NPDC058480]|uniref:SMI1/KNR4 family protein n=1 Tax=unclassified Nocardia TaxID=2637762 RepID=UPI00364D4D06